MSICIQYCQQSSVCSDKQKQTQSEFTGIFGIIIRWQTAWIIGIITYSI